MLAEYCFPPQYIIIQHPLLQVPPERVQQGDGHAGDGAAAGRAVQPRHQQRGRRGGPAVLRVCLHPAPARAPVNSIQTTSL